MPGSPITTLGELRGRKVAINAPDHILYLLAASVLTEHGVPPARVRFVVAENGFPAMPEARRELGGWPERRLRSA